MMNPEDLRVSRWRTSTRSGGGNQCVEVAVLPDGQVAVRDSKSRESGVHLFSAAAWTTFVAAFKHGA
jgi:Domain of unknown function (DUF397)